MSSLRTDAGAPPARSLEELYARSSTSSALTRAPSGRGRLASTSSFLINHARSQPVAIGLAASHPPGLSPATLKLIRKSGKRVRGRGARRPERCERSEIHSRAASGGYKGVRCSTPLARGRHAAFGRAGRDPRTRARPQRVLLKTAPERPARRSIACRDPLSSVAGGPPPWSFTHASEREFQGRGAVATGTSGSRR